MSCFNYCGGDDIVNGDCWCDKECEFFENCCTDYYELCFSTTKSTTPQKTIGNLITTNSIVTTNPITKGITGGQQQSESSPIATIVYNRQ